MGIKTNNGGTEEMSSDVKWIKIVTDIFDDEKMLLIESLPSADSIIVIWFKLLCLAGKNNNDGVFLLNDRIAYTDEMLSTIFRRDINTVRLALNTFEEFGMIEIVEGVITIPNWGKHQSLDKLENKKEYMRNYMKEYRQKQKKLIGVNKYNEIGLAPNEWKNVLEEFNYQCAYCGSSEDLEQDHVVSVKNGGEYAVGNIVPACRRCNASKNDKEVFEWYKEQDFYDENRCKNLHKYLRKYLHKTNVSSLEIDNKDNKDIKELDKKKNINKKKNFPPTVEEVAEYCNERGNGIDAQEFVNFYEASNWYRGKTKITDWKKCVITWERRRGFIYQEKSEEEKSKIPDRYADYQ